MRTRVHGSWSAQSGGAWLAVVGVLALLPGCYDLSLSPFVEEQEPAQGARLAWARMAGGDGQETGRLAMRPDGHLLTSGFFANQLLFGAGEAGETTLDAGSGASDAFVASFAPSGDLDWALRLHSTDYLTSRGVVVLSDGDIAVTGLLQSSITLDGVDGPRTIEARTASRDVLVMVLDPSGLLRWAATAGSPSLDDVLAIAALPGPFPGVLVGGTFRADLTFASDDGPEVTLPHEPGNAPQAFVARYDDHGELAWATQTVGVADVVALSATTETVFASGRFGGTTRFRSAASAGAEQTLVSNGGEDIYLAAYAAADGSLLWASAWGGKEDDSPCALHAADDGSFTIAGSFAKAMAIGGSNLVGDGPDVFVASFDAERKLRWVQTVGGPKDDRCAQLAPVGDGGFYLAGSFLDEPIVLGSPTFEVTLAPHGARDGFVARYDANGALRWARRLGGDATGSQEAVFDLVVPTAGSLIVGGTFEGRLSFGEGSSGQTNLTAVDNDLFFMRLDDP